MLALARTAKQAAQAVAFEPVDLPELLHECASTWLDTALAHGVNLGFELNPAQVQHASAWMLHELLGNLVHNAIRHSVPGDDVHVGYGTTEGGAPWLEVGDQGNRAMFSLDIRREFHADS
jgi:two-component system, OmpR family, sensor histidine kinase TctE